MGAEFFILSGSTDYRTGTIFKESSALREYAGAGNQVWFPESGTFTLAPGTYYWGFAATGNKPDSYIAIEGIRVNAVPEPSGAVFAAFGAAMLSFRRRRAAR